MKLSARNIKLFEDLAGGYKTIYPILREMEERRQAILGSIDEQGKMTPALQTSILAADTKSRLEDLYLPYKPRRRTKAQIAREAGLEPLANSLFEDNAEFGLGIRAAIDKHRDYARELLEQLRSTLDAELVEIIEESWASETLIPPYHIYLKMAYHLSQEARAGLTRPVLVHAILETARGVANVEEIAGLTSADYWFTDGVDDISITVTDVDEGTAKEITEAAKQAG